MPNIASILKSEISRIARKAIRDETRTLKKSVAVHRSEIASLKRRSLDLEQQLRRLGKTGRPAAASEAQTAHQVPIRFSAKGLASQRRRLGLSAQEVGLLLGVSPQSIYNWEEGKARPRAQHMPGVAALRTLGRRQAEAILEARISRR